MDRVYRVFCACFLPALVLIVLIGSARRVTPDGQGTITFKGSTAQEVNDRTNRWLTREQPDVQKFETKCPDGDIEVTVTYKSGRKK